MIRPSVGRIVLFRESEQAAECAAIVVNVHGDRMVNLCVFQTDGSPEPKTSVQLVQPEDDAPHGATMRCYWMEYQVGQASRTLQLEGEVSELKRRLEIFAGDAVDELRRRLGALESEIYPPPPEPEPAEDLSDEEPQEGTPEG